MTAIYDRLSDAQKREVRMYGVTIADMKEAVEQSLTFRFTGPAMYAMSLMSDCQEMLQSDNGGQYDLMIAEDVRQTLNRAKWILSTYVLQK